MTLAEKVGVIPQGGKFRAPALRNNFVAVAEKMASKGVPDDEIVAFLAMLYDMLDWWAKCDKKKKGLRDEILSITMEGFSEEAISEEFPS